ncbi:MAG: hypothetical protein K2G30_00310 [Muribaculaceae bacterium]|nr:hypothetical protein [Muribaculaceae bacterium]
MTKFYHVALAGALVIGSLAPAAAKISDLPLKKARSIEVPAHPALAKTAAAKKTTAKGFDRKAARVVSMAENDVWRPTTQVVSGWDPDEADWLPMEEITTTWDAAGRPLVDIFKSLEEEDEYSKTETVYDEYGYATLETSYVGTSLDDMTPSTRKVREYDPRIHNLIVSNSEERWDAATSSWAPVGNIYRNIVTRDDSGNVTCVQLELYYSGRWDPITKYDFFYGEDGKASKIVQSQMQFDYSTFTPTEWMEDIIYDNVEWYAFDGQIYDLDCIFEGNNKVKAYTQVYDGEPMVTCDVTYVGDTDDFTVVGNLGYAVYEQTWINYENGGYLNHVTQTEEAEEGEEPIVGEFIDCVKVNEMGNDLLVVNYEIYDGEMLFGGYSVGDETRDPDNGLLTSYESREFWPAEEDFGDEDFDFLASRSAVNEITAPLDQLEGEWENFIKIDYSDYTTAGTGAADRVATDIADGFAEYFTIDGRRVNGTPAAGLYIRRTSAGTTKILVK